MEKEEIMELSHEPKPGYEKAYYVVIAVGIIYLAITLAMGKIEHTSKKNNHTKTESHNEH